MSFKWPTLLPTRASRRAIAALVLAVIITLALNICVRLVPPLRLDFTAGGIYTLSPVTRDILRDMKEPVYLRLYVSRDLTQSSGVYAAYATHVRELLAVYAAKSRNKITLEVIDPESYSPEEDRAVGFGLRGIPLNGGDQQGGNQAYFGLVGTNTTDDTEIVPFLSPEREPFLEYDITKLVSALQAPQRKIVGVLDDAGALGGSHPWASLEQARGQFTLRQIAPNGGRIDPDISVLLVLHPKDLDSAMLFAIDQFVLGGGHALVFVDPDAESVHPANPSYVHGEEIPGGGASDLAPLFKAWGVAYDPGKVVGDWGQAMRIEAESYNRPVVTEFPPYIADKQPYLNANDPVTGDLKVVNLVPAGALTAVPGAGTTFTPLLQSSPHAALLNVEDAAGLSDPLGLVAKYSPGTDTFTMAARLVGMTKSAYPDGAPKARTPTPGNSSEGPILKQSEKPIEVIVVADTDLLADRSWVQLRDIGSNRVALPFANNGDFLINALENLSGGTQLAALRARGLSTRPLTRIEDLQRSADDRYRETENTLSQKLEEARRQLLVLAPGEAGGKPGEAGGKVILTGAQQDAARKFRTEMAETRQQLRAVQHDLRRNIDRLETSLKLANIFLVPLAVIIFALLIAHSPGRRPPSQPMPGKKS